MGLPVDCFGFLTKREGKGVGGQGGKGFGRAKTVKIHHTIVRQIFVEVRLPARRALSLSRSLALSLSLSLCRTYAVVGLKVSLFQAKVKSPGGGGQPFIQACPRRIGKGSGWKQPSAQPGR